jgi:phytoene dehydrogenase-like protein
LLGVIGTTPNIAENNVWFSSQDLNKYDQRKISVRNFARQPVHAHVPRDNRMSPTDSESWRISVPAPIHDPANGMDWNSEHVVAEYTEHIFTTLHNHGLDLSDRIQHQQAITPADFERSTGSPGGARFGITCPSPLGMLRRPKTKSSVEGLYFVGSSVNPGAGLTFAAMSANSVATSIGSSQ